jgi:enoyl-CoA hydratase
MPDSLAVYETLRYTVDGSGVATIALDQPTSSNALSPAVLAELEAAVIATRRDPEVRVVVLASTHETVFSSGGNLSGFAAEVPVIDRYLGAELFPRVFRLLGELGKPSICAASGHVLAGALGLALACDLIIAKDTARFGAPEINVGLFPFMVMALVYRNVPRKRATELLLLGEQISAHEAERIGLINRVVPAAEFGAAVADWASKLAAKSPLMLRLGKDAIFRHQDMPFVDALEYLRSQLGLAFSTDDLAEGVNAFFEKRDPIWKGR